MAQNHFQPKHILHRRILGDAAEDWDETAVRQRWDGPRDRKRTAKRQAVCDRCARNHAAWPWLLDQQGDQQFLKPDFGEASYPLGVFIVEGTVTVAEAARNLADLVDRACQRGETTVLTRSGVPVARLVPLVKQPLLGKDLAKLWRTLPHLSPEEGKEFEQELQESRSKLEMPRSKWE